MKKYTLMITVILLRTLCFGLDDSQPIMWDKDSDDKIELVEKISRHSTIFNWTKGKIITELTLPIDHTDPNLGRQTSVQQAGMRKELKQNLINSLGALRISDLFLLKDYYNLKSDIRYEIIARADTAFYYPPVERQGKLYGKMELPIFGKQGIANLFYRTVDRKKLTKYINDYPSKQSEQYDSLIIDTITFPEFQPSINMRIYDQDGTLLYGPEIVDQSYLFDIGVCEYTTSLRHAFESERSGNNIFYIIPFDIKGKMKTDLILHNDDAARLLANPGTLENLKKSRVIVVKPQAE